MALSSTAKIAVFVLTIASLVLTVIVYSDRQVFLIKVSPSIDPATGQGLVDGPTVLINAFGSCSRPSNASSFVCVQDSYPAKIDLSVLPGNLPDAILLPPPFFTALLWLALFFWSLGVVSVYVSAIYVVKSLEKFDFLAWAKIMSQVGLGIGFVIWLAQFVFFLKAAADFNASLALKGGNNQALSAQTGTLSGFLLIGLAYAFCLVLYVLTR